jgi:hypothetical protein
MSSNAKMVLFFIGATVFNILLLGVFVVVFLVIIVKALGSNPDQTVFQILLFVAFIGSIVLTFLVYGWVMKKITVKFKLETQIPQLFKGKKK